MTQPASIANAHPPRRIVCAAIRTPEGKLVCGPRHHHCFAILADLLPEREVGRVEQGFVDQWMNFLTREEAHALASQQGQIVSRCGGDATTLYSENLY